MSPRAKSATPSRRQIETHEHRDKQRVNNPPAGLVTPDAYYALTSIKPDYEVCFNRYFYNPRVLCVWK